ncbi:MAG TPA: succinylglutamate desuccinylase [Campylobacteraceae bacterium]|nr:succinylglutamate desuccinylase [Campylobacteraceae bacterium]HHD83242.1 succinylglutamate desuccinylase [Campylobacteraceae bacterium]
MTTTEIFSVDLPVGEKFAIRRTRFTPSEHGGEGSGKRISIVSGIHGDELEGQYAIFLLAQWLRDHPEAIRGTVDIYPAVNPLGIDTITRSFPLYNVDLNRVFPGGREDTLPGQVAFALTEDVRGSDIAIDIHSSNIFLTEMPQIRISRDLEGRLVPLARQLNCQFIWVHDAVTVLESTFAHTMNELGTDTLVVEMGVGMRVTPLYGHQLLKGMLNLMAHEGILSPEAKSEVMTPIYSHHGEVHYLNAPCSGLFIPRCEHGARVDRGDLIGEIVDPLHGEVRREIVSDHQGLLFTLRAYPVVYEGSLMARLFGEKHAED